LFYRLKISTNPPNRQTFLSIFTQNRKPQGGISFPTTHGMCDPGWNSIPEHSRNARPRVEFHSRPPAEWNFEVSLIRRHIKNGGIQTFPPLSIINIQKRAENLIENPFQ